MLSLFAVVVQTVAALSSLAWAPVALSRVEHEWMTICEWARLFIWNIWWFGFRVLSFAMLAAYSKLCLIVVVVTHIIAMVFWIWHDGADKVFGELIKEMYVFPLRVGNSYNIMFNVFRGMATGLFMLYYLTVTDSMDMVYFDFFYNIIVSYENAFSIGLFLVDPTLNVTNCMIMLIVLYVGVGVIFVFKFTKASTLIPLPQTCCHQTAMGPTNTTSTRYRTQHGTGYGTGYGTGHGIGHGTGHGIGHGTGHGIGHRT